MEKNEMIEKMVSLLADEFEVSNTDITPEASIKETLHLDSLSLVDMVGIIEEEFGVNIQASELATFRTFSDMYEFVYEHIN